MTVHHDKLAYGKLAASREDLSEESLEEMARLLSEPADEDCDDGREISRKRERGDDE